jgi:N6-adenosine-specific RNA methylase IME4
VKYRTIVADPPWEYPEGFAHATDRPHKQERERGEFVQTFSRVPLPYPSLGLGQIETLPVADLADKDCRLFLWTTNRWLPAALNVVTAWGFVYRQMVVWDKRPNVNPMSGSVAPNSAEFLLVAVRGKPARSKMWASSIVQARKARSVHSTKPDVFLDLVEQVSPGPYLEMFARRNRLGWDTWGNEALEHVDLGGAA